MLAKEIHALLALSAEPRTIRQLALAIGSTYARASQIAAMLLQKGFAVKTDGFVSLANTGHATLFKKIARKYDVEKLLRDSKEDLVLALLRPLRKSQSGLQDLLHPRGQRASRKAPLFVSFN